ncbi:hypothetical protein [Hoeflea prorocentri]|uniref:Uncharacterized protein n=1 Tax=Hoeflea prorocentri TaxID=1922333 RepID=A0A9X3UHF6_9HYPH|nr:hypothetical protein [Hoeflea prorocentri]MCY6380510.1 hypothetical protein [Hoeflea prorocentri]MDA5398310.1 hypothetical protein [Hoeflea prorocentri]
MRVLTMAIATLTAGASGLMATEYAAAQQLTNSMTCEMAKSVYASQGRVQTRTRSGVVLPIYGGVPEAKGRSLMCGRDRSRRPVQVITSDNPRCTIAYKC